MVVLAGISQAATKTWDGGGSGDAWTTGDNWDPNGIPGDSDDVIVGLNASVTDGQREFTSLAIQAGAKVTLATSDLSLLGGRTLNIAGTLDATATAGNDVLRFSTTTVNLSGALGSGIDFLDTNGSTINFTNGATFNNPNMNFEHKGWNTFGFKLESSGFTTINAGTLYSGSTGGFAAAWSNATYNIDISDYDLANGLSIVLMDFKGTATIFDGVFNPTVNIIAGDSGLEADLTFNKDTDALILTFPYPVTWGGGGNGANWAEAANWIPNVVPVVTDSVLVGTGASVTNASPNVFATLEIEPGATVSMAGGDITLGTRTLTVDGTLTRDSSGVVRLGGATIELSGHIGANFQFLDTNNGTINFYDGAAFDNPNMPFEHKGINTFGYKLSETGFTTLIAGYLNAGNSAVWSQATYNIDISDYDISNGSNIVLADYSGHSGNFNNTFDPTINITGLDGGKLSFDTATSQLRLKVYGPPGTIIMLK